MRLPGTKTALLGVVVLLATLGIHSTDLSGRELPGMCGVEASIAQGDDDAWWDGFGTAAQQGANGDIYALTVHDSALIAGGLFTRVGSVEADMIARWDGNAWHPLAGGIDHIPYPCLGPACVGRVFALTSYAGELIAGGNFVTVDDGNTPANYIARWDGSAWRSLGLGVDDQVHSLTVWRGKLVAGGLFVHAGGRMVNRIATWDGASWEPLATGLDGIPLDLAVYEDDLIAVGTFKRAGVLPMNHIARWDGQAWHSLGEGIGTTGYAVWVHNDDLVSDGRFTTHDGYLTDIGRWTNVRWEGLGAQGSSAIDLITHGDFLVAGGNFPIGAVGNNIARWDGAKWSRLGSGLDAAVQALAVLDGSLYVGGFFQMAGGKPSAYIARWDGPSTPVFLSDFRIVEGSGSVVLAWSLSESAVADLTGVIVERAVDRAGPYLERSPGPIEPRRTMDFVDTDLIREKRYWYRLGLLRGDGTRTTTVSLEAHLPAQSGRAFTLAPVEIADQTIVVRYRVVTSLPEMSLRIYDIRGQLVRVLERGPRIPGSYASAWDRVNGQGQLVSRGVYVAELRSDGQRASRKFVVPLR